MEWVVLFFLALSVFLYCLLGGADFGVGVHEWLVPADKKRRHEEVVAQAMGPVWEANHMWLIIVVVILFVAFPRVYSQVSIYLHIPLTLMLIGIIIRGCAFSFRHYDSVEDGSRKYYSWAFSFSSLLTPIAFGVIIAALMLGKIPPEPTDYYSTYVQPWFNIFSLTTGLFVLSIFTFIAGIFMVGEEAIGDLRENYVRRTKFLHIVMIIMGALVFFAARFDGFDLGARFFSHPLALTAMALATVSHFLLWPLFRVSRRWRLRIVTGFQLFMVVAAWLAVTFPDVIFYNDGTTLTLFKHIAPEKTLLALGLALIVGAALFLPLLGYLFFMFKSTSSDLNN